MSAISKEKIKIRVLNKKSRHLDRMTRRSGTINVTCIYEYINRKTVLCTAAPPAGFSIYIFINTSHIYRSGTSGHSVQMS
jgi:hypothetical protein